ncbi:MAG: hypothetical protein QXY86_00620, partial [Candidatus Micrarchaeaceae archaeon]
MGLMRKANAALLAFGVVALLLILNANAFTHVPSAYRPIIPTATTSYSTTTIPYSTTIMACQSPPGNSMCTDFCSGSPSGGKLYSSQTAGCAYTYTYNAIQSANTGGYIECGDSEQVNTSYATNQYYLSKSTSFYQFSYPLVSPVNASNAHTAPYLLACPLNPYSNSNANPTNQEYFYPDSCSYPFVAGGACSATVSRIATGIELPLTVTWSSSQAASASVGKMQVSNAGEAEASVLNMSPMVYSVGGVNYISNGYSSNTYIFQQVPSVAQHAVWNWTAVFVNFNNAQIPNLLTVVAEPQYASTYLWINPNGSLGFAAQNTGVSANEHSANASLTINGTPTATPSATSTTALDLPPSPTTSTITTSTSTTSNSTSTSTTSTIPPIDSYVCNYQYQYTAQLTLDNVQNTQIPFNEITNTIQGNGSAPVIHTHTFTASILPYLLFNYVLPSPYGAVLQNSYDIFSPWNYYTPTKTEEPFPIDTPSRFYVNYNGMLISTPSNDTISALRLGSDIDNAVNGINGILNSVGMGNFFGILKRLGMKSPYVANPISVAAIPNDYVFVLNESGGDYYITVLRLIPKGYFNTTGYAPTNVNSTENTSASVAEQEWDNEWNGYWANVIALQNETTYTVASYDLNSLNNYPSGFTPLNITANYAGDVFITGRITNIG